MAYLRRTYEHVEIVQSHRMKPLAFSCKRTPKFRPVVSPSSIGLSPPLILELCRNLLIAKLLWFRNIVPSVLKYYRILRNGIPTRRLIFPHHQSQLSRAFMWGGATAKIAKRKFPLRIGYRVRNMVPTSTPRFDIPNGIP